MPLCPHCQKSAGLFGSVHGECQKRHKSGCDRVRRVVYDGILAGKDGKSIRADAESIARASYIPHGMMDELIAESWNAVLDFYLDDGVLSDHEEKRLMVSAQEMQFNTHHLKQHNVTAKIGTARALKQIAAGQFPRFLEALPMPLPFVLQADEQLLWYFATASLWEEETTREYVSGSAGVNVRLAKGVHARVGGHRGEWTSNSAMDMVDVGVAGLTTKSLYFASGAASIRVPYRKIVGMQPVEEGVSFMQDGVRAKPQWLRVYAGPFSYHLVAGIIELATA